MQICDVILYSRNGQKRILPLRVGGISIITGSSSTGKSSLIDIVDYCLGRSTCNIPFGPIRDAVDWYALRLQFPSSQIFVARKSPPANRQTTNIAFLLEAEEVEIPEVIPQQNTTMEAIETHINNKLGISPNLNTPPMGQTRSPLAANFRHALLCCFQTQNDLTSREELFHRQNDNNGQMLLAIKDTLPYFLEAVREDSLRLEHDLTQAKRELKVAQRELADTEAIKGEGISNAVRLVSQAIQVGLLEDIQDMPSELSELTQLLQQAMQWNPPEDLLFSNSEIPDLTRLDRLQNQVRELQEHERRKKNEILAAETYAQEADGYEAAAHQQELRLESVGLFDNLLKNDPHDSVTCPLCSQHVSEPIPSVEAIRSSLQNIKQELDFVNRDRPQLREYIEQIQEEKEDIRQRLQITFREIEGIIREQEAAEQWRQQNFSRSRTIGRISLWLENAVFSDETFELESKVILAEGRVQEIQTLLDPEEKQDRLASALNRISLQMTQWAAQLGLEHADGQTPVHLNLSRATVIVDSPDRTIPLSLIGGGANVQGYHLITHFALHKYFIDRNRPTPRFLFLDQPSQVYFSNLQNLSLNEEEIERIKETGSIESFSDQDREAVKQLFDFIFAVFDQSLAANFQIIITDHVNLLDSPSFQDALVEVWRDGMKLVPTEWLNN
jgi:hypothetical protein